MDPADPTEREHSATVTFHGVDYILTISTHGDDFLTVELEQEYNDLRWRGDFTAEYVEDITRKTGNFKRFPVFVKMLVSAVQARSEAVFLDLLTFADLEMLKTRKGSTPATAGGHGAGMGSSHGSTAGSASATSSPYRHSNKRYLILTYRVEYDRVHYPLPLAFEEVPSTATLQRIIRRLRKELTVAKERARHPVLPADDDGVPLALRDAQQEVSKLKERLVEVADQRTALEQRLDAETQARARAEANLEKLRNLSRTELRRLRRDNERLAEQLAQAREDAADDRGAAEETTRLKEVAKGLRLKCRDLTRQLALARSRQGTVSSRMHASPKAASRTPRATSRSRSTSRSRPRPRPSAAARSRTPSPGPLTRPRSATRPPATQSVPRRGVAVGRTPPGSARSRTRRRAQRGSVSTLASGSDSDASDSRRRRRGRSPVFDPTNYERERQAKLAARRRAREAHLARLRASNGSLSDSSDGRRRRPAAAGSTRSRSRSRSPSPAPASPAAAKPATTARATRPRAAKPPAPFSATARRSGGVASRSRASVASSASTNGAVSRPPVPPVPRSRPQTRRAPRAADVASFDELDSGFEEEARLSPPPSTSSPDRTTAGADLRAVVSGGEVSDAAVAAGDSPDAFDPSAEIQDIDSRLQVLQSFLDAARASGVADSPSTSRGV